MNIRLRIKLVVYPYICLHFPLILNIVQDEQDISLSGDIFVRHLIFAIH